MTPNPYRRRLSEFLAVLFRTHPVFVQRRFLPGRDVKPSGHPEENSE